MFHTDQYQLLDFGGGRKLERFGAEVLDRPSPAAEADTIVNPSLWESASARFEIVKGGSGTWGDRTLGSSPDDDDVSWSVRHGEATLLMRLSASGNVGLFPEQASNWDWIADQVARCRNGLSARPPRVLNLFAYTGGATLAAAAAGAEVTHVDSSGPTVTAAKRNAEASGLADRPIRWLVEDAIKFAARECRRGNGYDGIILDPPTYGHGPKGRPFKFSAHAGELLALCAELLGSADDGNRFLLFSCHAPGFGSDDAAAAVVDVLPASTGGRVTSRPLVLESLDGRALDAGVSARWSAPAR